MSYLLGFVALVDESREHVAVVDGKVISLSIDVRRDHGREVAAVLILCTYSTCCHKQRQANLKITKKKNAGDDSKKTTKTPANLKLRSHNRPTQSRQAHY